MSNRPSSATPSLLHKLGEKLFLDTAGYVWKLLLLAIVGMLLPYIQDFFINTLPTMETAIYIFQNITIWVIKIICALYWNDT